MVEARLEYSSNTVEASKFEDSNNTVEASDVL